MAIYSSVRHHTGRQQVVYRCTVRKQLGDALSGGSSSVQVHYEETVRGEAASTSLPMRRKMSATGSMR